MSTFRSIPVLAALLALLCGCKGKGGRVDLWPDPIAIRSCYGQSISFAGADSTLPKFNAADDDTTSIALNRTRVTTRMLTHASHAFARNARGNEQSSVPSLPDFMLEDQLFALPNAGDFVTATLRRRAAERWEPVDGESLPKPRVDYARLMLEHDILVEAIARRLAAIQWDRPTARTYRAGSLRPEFTPAARPEDGSFESPLP